ncbi:MAG: 3-oxoacyl-[acyl-carrier-protein] synthase III C-terminal domain-containing protein [Anaerolineales bacterium]
MDVMPLKIIGVGRYLPARVVGSAEVEALCGLPAGWIERRSGVRERRWVDDETSSQMGAQAAREAVAEAGLELSDLSLIINASGTTEQTIPDGGPLIQRQLGLGSSGIPCLTVHATCLSFLVALDLSANLLATGRYENILIVSSEIGSVGINLKEPESASLLGDAAAAVVVTRTPEGESAGLHAARLETYGDGADMTAVRGGGSSRHPNNPATKPEDNLFHMNGPQVLRMALRYSGAFLEKLRPGLSTGLAPLKLVVPHQPSLMGLKAMEMFGWPAGQIVKTLDHLGNCVAASIPCTLYEAVRQGRLQRGDQVLLVGTGAGLSLGGVILTY